MKAANPTHALAITLVDELARCGVQNACLAPGSRSAALAMALAEDDRIELQVAIDERSASFMALGMGRATQIPAVVLSTSGTAAANLHPAIVEADASRIPLLVLTADRPPELRSTGANQTIDQLKLYGDSVRWFCELGVPEERDEAPTFWRSSACRAVAEAMHGPAGPVHVNVPMREPLVPEGPGYPHDLDGRADGSPWTKVSPTLRAATDGDIAVLADALSAAERPLIAAGEGRFDPDTVVGFAEQMGLPLLAEPLSNARRGPNAITAYDAMLRTAWSDRHRPDLVIRIGRIATSKALALFLGSDVRQVLLDPDGWWLDPQRSASSIVTADVDATLEHVTLRVGDRRSAEWLDSWLDAERRARSVLDAFLDADDEPSEPRAARDVAALIPDGSNLVVASSMPVRDLDSFMGARTGVTIYGNRGASGIDGFVSSAVGIAIATGRPTFALAGDLSMLHDQNGMIGLAGRGVDITFLALNNDGGGIFSFLPQANHGTHFETLFGTPHGIDFSLLARSYGIPHRLLERASELRTALEASGPRLLEIRTDRGVNVEVHRRAWEAVGAALD